MRSLLFGPAGIPDRLPPPERTTQKGIQCVAELGLGCMEVEFVQGVKMSEKSAALVGSVASNKRITLSAHGPYFINLNARTADKVAASKQRILQTARVASVCGAHSIVFHAAVYFDDPPGAVMETVKRELREVVKTLRAEDNHVWIRPELTGKPSQFGTLDELIELGKDIEGVLPCIDFAHLHARTGKVNSYDEFVSVLAQLERGLGKRVIEDMHMHISGIAYGKHGEQKHLEFAESDFKYKDLMRALKDYKVAGLAICESPTREDDALVLQKAYRALR